jgi:cellulose synthase/poly-beta-1,6-N-acetylglucosamine synthase-like glycosyltransferase
MIATILYSINGACLFLIFLYTLHQYVLTFQYFNAKKPRPKNVFSENKLPFITIQLPIYNEKYVLDSLFDCISKLNYPKNKLEIQVLDDSTDESQKVVLKKTDELRRLGFDVQYINRINRTNFKAGALANGLLTAKGEFFAIFDADFLPSSDWLQKVIHYFSDEKIAFVQTRWAYINSEQTLLTSVQAMALNYHFTIEQVGRNAGNLMFNFNGTAGIWRKEAIVSSGNWQGDTLTEDLDLSIRAQMAGWQSVFLEDVSTLSELPETMAAVRSQQFRWNKGGAQNLIKFWKAILKSKSSFFSKSLSLLHLLNSSIFLFVFIFAITSVPILIVSKTSNYLSFLLWPGIFLKYNFIFIFITFYIVHQKCSQNKNFIVFLKTFLAFFPYVLAIAWHNSLAVLEAYLGRKSDFIRTPKFNTQDFKKNTYHVSNFNWKIAMEVFWFLYFFIGIVISYFWEDFSYVGLYAALCIGFTFIFIKSIRE